MKKILITGSSGLIGTALIKKIKEEGYKPIFLVRDKKDANQKDAFYWNIEEMFIDSNAFDGVCHVVHLAGENIANKRWSKKQKCKIKSSRIDSSKLITQAIIETNAPIKSIVSASGIGFYGNTESEVSFTETDPPGSDFLARVCKDWEYEVNRATASGIRTVNIRTGVVLSNKGGAFVKITAPVKWGFGSTLGSGKQYIPWIHLDDLCALYMEAITNIYWHGPINAVAPVHVTNEEFTKLVGACLGKKIWLPKIPSSLLNLVLGELSTLVTTGCKISSEKMKGLQFSYRYSQPKDAIKNLLHQY